MILSIDTSHQLGSVALSSGGKLLGCKRFGESATHLSELGAAVGTLLEGGGVRVGDIERLALVAGPGSFTGLRIGLAFAKGLHAALDTPVVAVNTLDLLAVPLLERGRLVCSMIDARKREVYAALYKDRDPRGGGLGREVLPSRVISPEKLLGGLRKEPITFVGSGAVRYRGVVEKLVGGGADFAPDQYNLPSTEVLCRLADRLPPLEEEEVLSLEPFYIRSSDAELKRLRKIEGNG